MFGLVCSGRPVQTDCVQVDETKFTFTVEEAAKVNTLAIFLSNPLPPGTITTVHYQWKDEPFVLLGHLSNEKPSSIFRLSKHPSSPLPYPATIGLAIEPATMLPQLAIGENKRQIRMAEKMLGNFYDFMRSFEREGLVETKRVQEWYENVKRKVELDDTFLEGA